LTYFKITFIASIISFAVEQTRHFLGPRTKFSQYVQ
jgi:hypothetical protein